VSPNKDEPVAYLGGKPEDDESVAGYLGGQAGEAKPEELPALPPAGVSAVYSASDFIAPPPEVEEEPPPAYDSYAADPVAEPAPEAADVEQYAHAEPEPEPEPEPPPATATVVEQGAQEGSSDFDEPGLPKTISQQDAENIIKRITTKKILPPETQSEAPRISKPSELTPRGSPKLGRLIVLLIIVVGGYGAAVAFNDTVKDYLPEEAWPFIFYNKPAAPPEPPKPPEDTPAQKKEKALRKMVLESEWRAFDYKSHEEFEAANKELKAGVKKPADTGTPEKPQPPSDPNSGGH
jgi:hypothetical protein